MSFGKHNASSKALGDITSRQVGRNGCQVCGLPRRPHTAFCGDVCRFWAKVRKGPGCWEWTGARFVDRNGVGVYGQFSIGPRDDRKTLGAHRFSYELHHGPMPEGMETMHSCHNGLCVRPDHLTAGTHLENVRMSADAGNLHTARPSRHKLTPQQIADVRERVACGPRGTAALLAKELGVTKAHISQVVSGRCRQIDAPMVPQQIEQAS
jgi:hypothetical protein